jgi:signal transduction histidine kinase/HAMP domain-containing protein
MKKRIIGYLSLLFVFFAIGSITSILYITITTSQLKNIIELHNIEILRQDLVIRIQNVERDLLTVHTELGRKLDRIVLNVTELDKAVIKCEGCHHSPVLTQQLKEVKVHVEKFKTALSHYITASADLKRISSLKKEAHNIGAELFRITSQMTLLANQRLQEKTRHAINDVGRAQQILILTLFATFLVGIWIAVALARNIIRPIRELINVSREIGAGNLGYTTGYTDSTEFGELAKSFNEMSLSLKKSNVEILLNLKRLTGLYRVTLPLHSVSDMTEVFKEVSYSIAEFIDIEQCGLLLLDEDSKYFEHGYPAFGLDERQVVSIRVNKKDMQKLYFSNDRRPLIVNDLKTASLPEELLGGDNINVSNIMLGWVRKKDELIGVLRLANKKEGVFSEETSRLVGIITNNIFAALENIKLYEDLKAQMNELKETQEQLVHAAKLAAIGEVISNVAHELNNPLTSIIGYAELIKEETDINNIMKDVDIIEKEARRSGNIIHELLEFSRKRPLAITKIDLNVLIDETISLVTSKLRDTRIKMIKEYSEIPLIMGDPNQLKQVFLNIFNNAMDAISGNEGEIKITTARKNKNVIVEVYDNGEGIPDNVLKRIFEPFFTTKKDKGTGIGLSITQKIVQNHKGKIDITSKEGEWTKFAITLQIYI